jgi:hypothetical protein
MSSLGLTTAERRRLEQQLHQTREVGLFRRILVILKVADSRPIAEIAPTPRTSRLSVHHWIECYEQARDLAVLADQRAGNHRRSQVTTKGQEPCQNVRRLWNQV